MLNFVMIRLDDPYDLCFKRIFFILFKHSPGSFDRCKYGLVSIPSSNLEWIATHCLMQSSGLVGTGWIWAQVMHIH